MSNASHNFLPTERDLLRLWRSLEPSLQRVSFSSMVRLYKMKNEYLAEHPEHPDNLSAKTNLPSHQLFNENEGPGKKWLSLGVAWRQKNNPDAFVIKLDIVPSSGRILMFGTSR